MTNDDLSRSIACLHDLHASCPGLSVWWEERYCGCAPKTPRCPHTLHRPCECDCHGTAA